MKAKPCDCNKLKKKKIHKLTEVHCIEAKRGQSKVVAIIAIAMEHPHIVS